MPPFAKNATESHTPARATFRVLNTVALGFGTWAAPNPIASTVTAAVGPIASASRRKG